MNTQSPIDFFPKEAKELFLQAVNNISKRKGGQYAPNVLEIQIEIDKIAFHKEVTFLKEWSHSQFTAMGKAIAKHFKNRVLQTNYGLHTITHSFNAIDELLGLAYTSSSSCAMYSICNVVLAFDATFNYEYFAIGNDGNYYAILWDKEENEKIIRLNN